VVHGRVVAQHLLEFPRDEVVVAHDHARLAQRMQRA
jgi:hypothetical protein